MPEAVNFTQMDFQIVQYIAIFTPKYLCTMTSLRVTAVLGFCLRTKRTLRTGRCAYISHYQYITPDARVFCHYQGKRESQVMSFTASHQGWVPSAI